MVKKTHLPVQETQVRALGQEDPLEKEMATHSRILSWENPHGQKSLKTAVFGWKSTVCGVAKESDMTGQLNNK